MHNVKEAEQSPRKPVTKNLAPILFTVTRELKYDVMGSAYECGVARPDDAGFKGSRNVACM